MMVLKIFLLFVACTAFAAAQNCGKLNNLNVEDKAKDLPWTLQLREKMTKEVICLGTLISERHAVIGEFLWATM
jgi:hypothetical protein